MKVPEPGRSAAVMAVSLALAACGPSGSQEPAKNGATADLAKPAPARNAGMPDLDPAYLAGDWCYVSITAGSKVEPEHITYRFNPDGTLLYQNATGTPLDRPGNWSSEGGRVVIKPTLMMFKLHVKEQQPDRLVLSGMGDMLFTRGACGTPG